MDADVSTQRPARRKHSAAFKARILRACSEPGASVAGIAVAHGLNPNMVQRWRREARRGELVLPQASEFVPVVAAPASIERQGVPDASDMIELRLQRGALHARVRWPVRAAGDCAAFLRELLR